MREGEPKNESNEQKYLKHTGKESLPVEIISGEKIGEGHFGEVFSAETQITKKDRVKKKNFAVKAFHSEGDALKALENFNTLKENGLKTFTTYRLAEDGKSILMTNGNRIDSLLVSYSDSESLNYLRKHPIKEIANFEQLVTDMIEHAKLAANKKILLPNDSYFFSISDTDEPDVKNIDFIIGDLDNVLVIQDGEMYPELNLSQLSRALYDFVNYYVYKANKPKYLNLLSDAGLKNSNLF